MAFFNFKKRTAKGTERSKLIRKLDDLFSEYIRVRDCDTEGNIKCITCDTVDHWKDMQCGHFVDRAHMATRWEVKNANGQCPLCNYTHDGKFQEHGKAIDIKFGYGTATKLLGDSRYEKHFMEHELKGMIEELKVELKALKSEKFGLTQTRE